MSDTDNTRPYAKQAKDAPAVRRKFGDSHFHESLPFPMGGQNSFNRYAKPYRKQLSRKIRARVRQFAHQARYALDVESADLLPERSDRRTVCYTLI